MPSGARPADRSDMASAPARREAGSMSVPNLVRAVIVSLILLAMLGSIVAALIPMGPVP